jgi:hypothetical protein
MVAGGGHHQGGEPETDALGGAAYQQRRERQRDHGQHAARDRNDESGEYDAAAARAGAESSQYRRGDRAGQQGDRQSHWAAASETR